MTISLARRDFLALASTTALIGCATPTATSSSAKLARTTSGQLQGIVEDGVNAFKGVRYGAPPVGALRFLPPQKPAPVSGIVDASAFGAPAVQMYTRPSGEASSVLGKTLADVFPTAQETRAGNEDCLFLNVWSAGVHDGRKRPIMVWLHGGGMVYGSGAWPAFNGAHLAKHGDVVVVTVNHRLNAFGFSYLADAMGADFADSGNAGHLDLVAALEWVRDNADAFGGDAGNVTIFGQSGGGGKVSTLLATPAAKGLFHKAIVESGPQLRVMTKADASAAAAAVLAELGVAKGDVAKLRAARAEQIRLALYAAQTKAKASWGPVKDGRTLTRDPFDPDAPPEAASVPLLIGTNKDELALFLASAPWYGKMTSAELDARAAQLGGPAAAKAAATNAAFRKLYPAATPTQILVSGLTAAQFWRPTLLEAERKAAQPAPVYMYRMDWETPIGGGVYHAGHSLETVFVFDNVEANRAFVGPGPEPQLMAKQMSAAWLAFAHKGDPSAAGLPHWPRFDTATRATMIFNLHSRVENDPYAEVRKILET